jgi:hypothetical protein
VTVVNPVTLTAQPPNIDVSGSSDLTASVMAVGGPDGGVDGGATLSYDFSCPTCTAGGLRPAGGGATTAGPLCSETNQVTYVPNANVTQTTKDGVSVTAYNAPGCSTGTGMAVGTASTPVTVTVDKMDAGSSAGTGTFVIGGTTFSFSDPDMVILAKRGSGWEVDFDKQNGDFGGQTNWTGNGTGTYPCTVDAQDFGTGSIQCGSWAIHALPGCTITITSFGSNPGDRVIGFLSAAMTIEVSGNDLDGGVSSANGHICPDISGLYTDRGGPPISGTFDVPAP